MMILTIVQYGYSGGFNLFPKSDLLAFQPGVVCPVLTAYGSIIVILCDDDDGDDDDD